MFGPILGWGVGSALYEVGAQFAMFTAVGLIVNHN